MKHTDLQTYNILLVRSQHTSSRNGLQIRVNYFPDYTITLINIMAAEIKPEPLTAKAEEIVVSLKCSETY